MNESNRRNERRPQVVAIAPRKFDEVGSRGRQFVVLFLVTLVALVVWASTSQATPQLHVSDKGGTSLRTQHHHVESGSSMSCDDTRCGTSLTQDACAACSLYRQTMSAEHLEHVRFHGFLIERGVALRATSTRPEIQAQLFSVALARNDILQQVHDGSDVDLCEPCNANARTFLDVQFGVERIPEGVILSYTSSRDDLVELLQVMILNGYELPL